MKKLLLAVIVGLMSVSAFAQMDLTLYNARYLQQASYTNASFFPECRVNVQLLFSGSGRYANNGLNRGDILRFGEGLDGTIESLDNMKDLNLLEAEGRLDLLQFGFRVKGKNYFGLNASVRSQTALSYTRDMAAFMFLGNGVSADDPGASAVPSQYQFLGERADFENTGVTQTVWTEIGLQYARKLLPEDQLVIGIRPKLLLGVAHANTTYNFGVTTDAETFGLTIDGGYTTQFSTPFVLDTVDLFDAASGDQTVDLDVNPFANIGVGLDFGATYNITEKFQVSAAVNDLGFINWTQNTQTYEADNGSFEFNGIPLDGSLLNVGNNFDTVFSGLATELTDSLNSQFGADSSDASFRTSLTARYNVGVNYQFAEKHNVGLLVNAHRVRQELRAAMTLSYNFRVRKWFGFHANYSIYNRSFANVGLGLSFNLFPIQFFIMSDNVLGPILPSARNIHTRAGINLTFGCKSDDRDKDGIPDKEDECPKDAGTVQFKGCPDTDGDGIKDSEDKCPTEKGPKESNGCPDRDGDGIVDNDDECPDAPGTEELKGCPDSDEDGIADENDECPTVAGVAAFNGCPDTDSDGVRDSEDECPELAGTAEYNGCPDTDGDGVTDQNDECPEKPGPAESAGCPDTDGDGLSDNEDNCPDQKGPVDNSGCPLGDRDGDGTPDKQDSCPDAFGPAENAGCPYSDLDGDGVFDKDDRCPQTPGVASNAGCPEIKQEEQEVLKTAFDNLEFEVASDKIKASSFESLDKLAELLNKKEDWKIKIAGHTDSQGSESTNLVMSEKRAKAVANYLNSKGVDTERMIIQWFGESKPIASNDTPEGRQQNRRVEMEIVFD